MNTLKRLVGMVFRRSTTSAYSLWKTVVPWYQNITDVLNSSLVAAVLQWCARNFPEAPPALWRKSSEGGQPEQIIDHPMLRLLEKPNEYYDGTLLWMATIVDYKADGNAYWLKLRDGTGQVAELWWIPSWMMTPVGTERDYIDHYEYAPNSETAPYRVDPANIVHFRNGLDCYDNRRGVSQLKSVLREVYTDDEAATFTAAILSNMGVPGVVISPDASNTEVTEDDLKLTKQTFDQNLRGSNRGGAIVMRGPTRISQFGFSPEQLVLRDLRRIPEERVSAALGVPAIVVGLGAGLDRSTFTNMGEAMEYAYSNGLIPDQRIISGAVRWQLLTEWESDPFMWKFGFDLSEVRALQDDFRKKAERWNLMINGGWSMVSEGRRDMGLPVDDARDDVFLRQGNLTMVHGSTDALTPLAPAIQEKGNVGDIPAGDQGAPRQNGAGALVHA